MTIYHVSCTGRLTRLPDAEPGFRRGVAGWRSPRVRGYFPARECTTDHQLAIGLARTRAEAAYLAAFARVGELAARVVALTDGPEGE